MSGVTPRGYKTDANLEKIFQMEPLYLYSRWSPYICSPDKAPISVVQMEPQYL